MGPTPLCCGEDENNKTCVKVPLRHVLEYALSHDDDDPLYVFDSHYEETCPTFLDDYAPREGKNRSVLNPPCVMTHIDTHLNVRVINYTLI